MDRLARIWRFLVANWHTFVILIGAAAAVILGIQIMRVAAELGWVKRKDNFQVKNEDHLLVWSDGKWIDVDLRTIQANRPVKAKNVVAVQLDPGKAAVVEVHNASIDDI